MTDIVLSTNMSLPVPVVGVAAGPDWASDINACLTIIDSHNHTAGSGVPITPSAMNINSDVTFANNNATNLRSSRFFAQSAPLALASDLGCLYVSGVDLYYNDGNGNQIRVTQSGNVAGSTGTITGLPSGTASAAYSSGSSTFVFQSATNTPANLDGASVLLRNLSANSKSLTLSPPAAMGSNFTITLPSLPAAQKIMTLDNSGNVGAAYDTDNVTLEVSSNNLQIKDSGVSTAKIATAAVTQAKLAVKTGASSTATAGNIAISSGCGQFTTTSLSYVTITNLSVTITTLGSPVILTLVADAAGTHGTSIGSTTSSGTANAFNIGAINFQRDSTTTVGEFQYITVFNSNVATRGHSSPVVMDPVAAGTYTYRCRAIVTNGSTNDFAVIDYKLMAYEL